MNILKVGVLLGSAIIAANAASAAGAATAAPACPDWLNQNLRLLHSQESKNICAAYAGRPLLIINTASHCGFTPQFDGLQKIHEQYKDKGLVVLGFPSNDFFQEEAKEDGAAKVCYVNYGVTFDMFSPSHVRGDEANPVFIELGRVEGAPKWNFYKYLVDRNGEVVASFNSRVTPDDKNFTAAIDALVKAP
jgi:glutathione peroxidase